LKLVEQVAASAQFDDRTIHSLRSGLTAPDSVGEVTPQPKPAVDHPGQTNQAAFEQYRRLLEHQLRRPPFVPPLGDAYMFGISVFSEWGSRYLHRLRTISDKDGRLADIPAQQALVARQRALDAVEVEMSAWDPELRQVLHLCVANPLTEYDIRSLEEPHGYGPSLRRLWAEAIRRGESDADAWKSVVAWARHRPAAWEAEDRRKKKGLAHAEALGQHFARQVAWTASGDLQHPWTADVDGQTWRVRLNDFPDDLMYSLLIGDAASGDFHDWPETWQRG
jgi:hypothetical protein